MRLGLGLILMLVGGGVMLAGIVMALLQLGSLYQGAIDDPLGQPLGTEDSVRYDMLHWVGIGAIGVVPFLIGVVLFKGALARIYRRRRLGASARR